jgi:hypothetical protein
LKPPGAGSTERNRFQQSFNVWVEPAFQVISFP